MKKFALIGMLVVVLMMGAAFAGFAQDSKLIGLSMNGRWSLIFVAGENYMRYAAEKKGFLLTTKVANDDVIQQAKDIQDLINQGADILIVIPVDSKLIGKSIKLAQEKKIPVITYNRKESADAIAQADAFCGQDTVLQAYDAGVALAKVLAEDGVKPQDVKILNILGDLKDENGLNRKNGYEKAAKEFGWQIVGEVPTYWKREEALQGTLAALKAHPEVNVLMLASDWFWPEVKTVLEKQNKLHPRGEAGHIYVTGQDLYPLAIKDIKGKLMDASTIFDVYQWSQTAIEVAEKLMKGEPLEQKINMIRGRVMTLENVDTLENLWAKDFSAE